MLPDDVLHTRMHIYRASGCHEQRSLLDVLPDLIEECALEGLEESVPVQLRHLKVGDQTHGTAVTQRGTRDDSVLSKAAGMNQ